MKTWKVTIKERGNKNLLTPSYSVPDDNTSVDRKTIIEYFGLLEPDVEWYNIELEQTCCICGKIFIGYGNNPYHVKDEGRCCAECNATIVVPERVKLLTVRKIM